jgi:hypothetical protein
VLLCGSMCFLVVVVVADLPFLLLLVLSNCCASRAHRLLGRGCVFHRRLHRHSRQRLAPKLRACPHCSRSSTRSKSDCRNLSETRRRRPSPSRTPTPRLPLCGCVGAASVAPLGLMHVPHSWERRSVGLWIGEVSPTCWCGCVPPRAASQIKMAELQASLTSAEAAHAAAQSTIVAVTTDRDDLKEAVTTLRRRIRDLETAVARSGAEVRDLALCDPYPPLHVHSLPPRLPPIPAYSPR